MKRYSAIYSLPRSGSAWLSMFLSQPGSFCYHDPLADVTVDDLLKRMAARPEGHVAFIDTSLHQRSINLHPTIICYVLLREQSQVQRSLRMKGWVMNLDTEQDRLRKASEAALPIHYERLHDLNYLEALWRTIVAAPFDHERAEYLVEMNVQRDFASVAKRVCSTSA